MHCSKFKNDTSVYVETVFTFMDSVTLVFLVTMQYEYHMQILGTTKITFTCDVTFIVHNLCDETLFMKELNNVIICAVSDLAQGHWYTENSSNDECVKTGKQWSMKSHRVQ